MSFAAKLHRSFPEKRAESRQKLALGLTLHEADGSAIDVDVENVSLTGIGLRSRQRLPVGARMWLGIPGMGDHAIEIVRREGDMYGCRLDKPLGSVAAGIGRVDDTVVYGRFAARAEAFLHDTAPPAIEIVKWPRAMRGGMAIAVPLALWLGLIGAWFGLR